MYFASAIKYTDREQDFLSQKSLLAGTEIEMLWWVTFIQSHDSFDVIPGIKIFQGQYLLILSLTILENQCFNVIECDPDEKESKILCYLEQEWGMQAGFMCSEGYTMMVFGWQMLSNDWHIYIWTKMYWKVPSKITFPPNGVTLQSDGDSNNFICEYVLLNICT